MRSTIDGVESKVQDWDKKKKKGKNAEEVPYAVSRYVPVVKRLVEVPPPKCLFIEKDLTDREI